MRRKDAPLKSNPLNPHPMKTFLLSLVHHKKIGGLHFIRLGSLSLSFCRTKKRPLRKLRGSFDVLPSFARSLAMPVMCIVASLCLTTISTKELVTIIPGLPPCEVE